LPLSDALPDPIRYKRRLAARARNRTGPWAGVDVGGRRKGFDVAIVDARGVVEIARRCPSPASVLRVLDRHEPSLVAVDSPCSAAPDGATLRECERELREAVCGIRWTPDRATLERGDSYHEWIRLGLELYRALEAAGWSSIEVFPTASWTRWEGERRGSRVAWTTSGLANLGLRDLPARTNQDVRDAIAAAVTARQHSRGETEAFGPIVVPGPGAVEIGGPTPASRRPAPGRAGSDRARERARSRPASGAVARRPSGAPAAAPAPR
jgi:predicted nuclease with RNAse H fold